MELKIHYAKFIQQQVHFVHKIYPLPTPKYTCSSTHKSLHLNHNSQEGWIQISFYTAKKENLTKKKKNTDAHTRVIMTTESRERERQSSQMQLIGNDLSLPATMSLDSPFFPFHLETFKTSTRKIMYDAYVNKQQELGSKCMLTGSNGI